MGKENKRLIRLMRKHSLTSREVADLLKVKITTVQKWRQADSGIGYRNMPPGLLELLEIKLGETKWHV
jgi:hypothetical protein